MPDLWLREQIEQITRKPYAQLTEEAFAECERCQGRQQGLCDGEYCRHFAFTASEGEKEAAGRVPITKFKMKIKRGFVGAVYVEP